MGLDLDRIREHTKTCDREAHPCGPLLAEVERLRAELAKRSLPEGLRDPVKAFARGRELLERHEGRPSWPSSLVEGICVAYESGFGHGLQGDGLVNPYPSGDFHEAYEVGYNRGSDKAERSSTSVAK